MLDDGRLQGEIPVGMMGKGFLFDRTGLYFFGPISDFHFFFGSMITLLSLLFLRISISSEATIDRA